tara:strand:- start:511 stop:978 length:468 start_codon:yes stop_codon:yes gene_type:complete
MNLFGFQIGPGEKSQAVVLPENVAALFGATEGIEMIVDATPEGAAAIEAAEIFMVDANATLSAHETIQTELSALTTANTELEAKIASLTATNETLTAENTNLATPPATNHTEAPHQADAQEGGDGPQLTEFEKLEANARESAAAFNEKFPSKNEK